MSLSFAEAIGATTVAVLVPLVLSCVGDDPSATTSTDPQADAAIAIDGAPNTPDSPDASSDAATHLDGSLYDAGCMGSAACERVIFATQNTKTGNLGGAAGADAFCTAEANSVAAHARVRGREFVAWISVFGADAIDRHVHGTGAYVRPDGARVAADFNALLAGTLENNLGIDQFGAAATGTVWTGTGTDGKRATNNCVDFVSPLAADLGVGGLVTATDSTWTVSASFKCDRGSRVLCIEK